MYSGFWGLYQQLLSTLSSFHLAGLVDGLPSGKHAPAAELLQEAEVQAMRMRNKQEVQALTRGGPAGASALAEVRGARDRKVFRVFERVVNRDQGVLGSFRGL